MKKTSVAACCTVIVVCCTLVFTQCKKSNDTNAKSGLLTSAAWKYKEGGLDLDNNGSGETPIPAGTLQACDLDNTLTFKADNSGVVDEGATKCDATYPQSTIFKYTYNSSTNVINFSTAIFAGISGDAQVLELTATQMRVSKAISLTGSPIQLTVVITLAH